jgi:hypothetical protein
VVLVVVAQVVQEQMLLEQTEAQVEMVLHQLLAVQQFFMLLVAEDC